MKTLKALIVAFFALQIKIGYTQNSKTNFETEPQKAQFVTKDIPNFWKSFDEMATNKKAFEAYIENGSQGLKDFIPYRIESARNLYKTAKKRKGDYQAIRENSYKVAQFEQRTKDYYQVLKDLYEDAVFPPAYFVVGAFNSGGTSSENGIIMGVEMQTETENLPYIVAHELIHFNQNYSTENQSLLTQSIKEGAADFIGELISGKHINEAANKYGNEHEQELCAEFVEIMNDDNYHGWLYGGNKKDRPNDLGYWTGYKICEAYYAKSTNKKEAVYAILNIQDFDGFLEKSGYLSEYLVK